MSVKKRSGERIPSTVARVLPRRGGAINYLASLSPPSCNPSNQFPKVSTYDHDIVPKIGYARRLPDTRTKIVELKKENNCTRFVLNEATRRENVSQIASTLTNDVPRHFCAFQNRNAAENLTAFSFCRLRCRTACGNVEDNTCDLGSRTY